jgi:hypothetical protein
MVLFRTVLRRKVKEALHRLLPKQIQVIQRRPHAPPPPPQENVWVVFLS